MHPKSLNLTVGLARTNSPRIFLGLGENRKSQLGLTGQGWFPVSWDLMRLAGGGGRSKINVPVTRLWRVKEGSRQCEVLSRSLWIVLTLLETGSL